MWELQLSAKQLGDLAVVTVLWGRLERKLEDRGFFGHFWESMGTQTAGEVFRSWHALRGPSGHSGSRGRGDSLRDRLEQQ